MKTHRIGHLAFESSSAALNEAFVWAKQQALSYAHWDDPVGPWYEASLPGRDAFCMRDIAHQSTGAHLLGLQAHNKNMLSQFAKHIAGGRDWCSYWEITKDGLPAPVDYTDDSDFWYNLPANFDLIDCCLRQYHWTYDKDYIQEPAMVQFYHRSVTDYIDRWDKDNDGLPEHYAFYGRRGIASYVEDGMHPLVAGDLVAALYAGYKAYAEIQQIRGYEGLYGKFVTKAAELRQKYNQSWWNERTGRYNGAILQDRSFHTGYYASAQYLPLQFGLVEEGVRLNSALLDVVRHGGNNVEERSYLAEIFYNYGLPEVAYSQLLQLSSPDTPRREYPEVSYSVVSSLISGMMGAAPDATCKVLATLPRLSPVSWASAKHIPVWNNEVHLSHNGHHESVLENAAGPAFVWEARFPGEYGIISVDGTSLEANVKQVPGFGPVSWIRLDVEPGQKINVRAAK